MRLFAATLLLLIAGGVGYVIGASSKETWPLKTKSTTDEAGTYVMHELGGVSGVLEYITDLDSDDFLNGWALTAWEREEALPMFRVFLGDEDKNGMPDSCTLLLEEWDGDKQVGIDIQLEEEFGVTPISTIYVDESQARAIKYYDFNRDGYFDVMQDVNQAEFYVLLDNAWTKAKKTVSPTHAYIEIESLEREVKFEDGRWMVTNEPASSHSRDGGGM